MRSPWPRPLRHRPERRSPRPSRRKRIPGHLRCRHRGSDRHNLRRHRCLKPRRRRRLHGSLRGRRETSRPRPRSRSSRVRPPLRRSRCRRRRSPARRPRDRRAMMARASLPRASRTTGRRAGTSRRAKGRTARNRVRRTPRCEAGRIRGAGARASALCRFRGLPILARPERGARFAGPYAATTLPGREGETVATTTSARTHRASFEKVRSTFLRIPRGRRGAGTAGALAYRRVRGIRSPCFRLE